MKSQVKVLVVGGGAVGLSSAHAVIPNNPAVTATASSRRTSRIQVLLHRRSTRRSDVRRSPAAPSLGRVTGH